MSNLGYKEIKGKCGWTKHSKGTKGLSGNLVQVLFIGWQSTNRIIKKNTPKHWHCPPSVQVTVTQKFTAIWKRQIIKRERLCSRHKWSQNTKLISQDGPNCVCVHPFTCEGGLLLSGGAQDPNGALNSYFTYVFFIKFELK